MGIEWNKISEAREYQKGKLPPIWKIPFVTDDLQLILSAIEDGETILDIGAHDRALERKLVEARRKIIYKSMDVDKSHPHDYYSLDEVKETFDVVICLEVIEHMDFESGHKMLERIFQILKPCGRLIISTPNIAHPTVFWTDPTHITPYNYKELAGILMSLGFKDIRLFRLTSWGDLHRKSFRKMLRRRLCRYLELDFAKRIGVLCQK